MSDTKYKPIYTGPREDLMADQSAAKLWFFDQIEMVAPKLPENHQKRVKSILARLRAEDGGSKNLGFRHEIRRDERGNNYYRGHWHHVFHIGLQRHNGWSAGRIVIRADGTVNEENLIRYIVFWCDKEAAVEHSQECKDHNAELLRSVRNQIKVVDQSITITSSPTVKNSFTLELQNYHVGRVSLRGLPVESLVEVAGKMKEAMDDLDYARDAARAMHETSA